MYTLEIDYRFGPQSIRIDSNPTTIMGLIYMYRLETDYQYRSFAEDS